MSFTEVNTPTEGEHPKCEYGCNRPAHYLIKNTSNEKYCCSYNHAKCPAVRKKIKKSLQERHSVALNGYGRKINNLYVTDDTFQKLRYLCRKNNVKLNVLVNAFVEKCLKDGGM